MRISRVIIQNFRSFEHLDVELSHNTTCIIGENNTGKTNFLHAVRLCIDATLSSTFRALIARDIHSQVDISQPSQVLIGLEFTDFAGKVNEESLVGAWQHVPEHARLIYRFRPKLKVREGLKTGEIKPGTLTLDDYHWEINGGGSPDDDIAEIEWDEDIGSSIRFADLQAFQVIYLPALRDVESDLRQQRNSPLARLIEAMKIDSADQEKLLKVLKTANDQIASDASISAIAKAIDKSFSEVTGPAFDMDVALGVAEPSFQAIVRALRLLLSNDAMKNFDPSCNGLGLNNVLYVSILFEWFRRRVAQEKTAGQIILFEEPEAHLHPQLQLTLYDALSSLPFQSILTTHSTHITAQAPLLSYVTLTQVGDPSVASCVLAEAAGLDYNETRDLERYLDATKSNLLYARRVMLVEGPAELFLIPALLKKVKGIDLNREGIAVIPIYGVHFGVYAQLFSVQAMPKRCAIVADGDAVASDAHPELEGEDDLPEHPTLSELETDYVKVFSNRTTFERACVFEGTLEMFASACDDIGAPIVAKRLRASLKIIKNDKLEGKALNDILNPLRDAVLNTAKRFGKARFAQLAARHVDKADAIPHYLAKAAQWLKNHDAD